MNEAMHHYTNKKGYNGIRAQSPWRIRASKPPPEDHPFGAYFSTLAPGSPNLALRLRVPVEKTEFVFCFLERGDLRRLRGGRGGARATGHIFYSPEDYLVEKERHLYEGPANEYRRD